MKLSAFVYENCQHLFMKIVSVCLWNCWKYNQNTSGGVDFINLVGMELNSMQGLMIVREIFYPYSIYVATCEICLH